MTPQAFSGRSAPGVHRPRGLRGPWSVQRAMTETTCLLEAGAQAVVSVSGPVLLASAEQREPLKAAWTLP